MTAKIDPKLYQSLIPLNALTPSNFTDLINKARMEEWSAKRYLFKLGETDEWTTFVLSGQVALINAEGETVALIEGGTRSARHPIDPQHIHAFSARAQTDVTGLRVNSNLLDLLLTWDQSGQQEESYEVAEPEENWISRLLQSPIFQQIPAINIPKIIAAMQERPVQAGEVIVRQQDVGDYYYYIQEGRCEVIREAADGSTEKLAELGHGATFGEEALLSEARRNATVRMLTPGILMALAKADFVELIKTPLEYEISYARAQELVQTGAIWIDVRLREEYQKGAHFANSINLPLQELRELADQHLSTDKIYITCCDTGRRSMAAAFILNQRNFHAYALQGGLHLLPDHFNWAPTGHTQIDIDETPTAITQSPKEQPPSPIIPVIPDDTLKLAQQLQEKSELARKKAQAEVARLKQLQLDANEKISQAAKIRAQADAKLKQAHLLQQQFLKAQQHQTHQTAQAQAEVQKLRAEQEQLKVELERLQANANTAQQDAVTAQQTLLDAQQKLQAAQQLSQEAERAKKAAEAEATETRAFAEDMQQQIQREVARLKQQAEQTAQMTAEAERAQQQAQLKLQQAEQLKADADAAQQAAAETRAKLAELEQAIQAKITQERLEAEQLKAEVEAEKQALQQEALKLQALQVQVRTSYEPVAGNLTIEDEHHIKTLQEQAAQKLREAEQLKVLAEQTREAAAQEANRIRLEHEQAYRQLQQEVQQLQSELSSQRLQQEEATNIRQEYETLKREREQMQAIVAHANQKLQEAMRLKTQAQAQQAVYPVANTQQLEQAVRLKTEAEATRSVAQAEIGRIDQALKQSQQAEQLKSSLDKTSAQVASLKEAKETIEHLKKSLEQARQQQQFSSALIANHETTPTPPKRGLWAAMIIGILILGSSAWVLKPYIMPWAQQLIAQRASPQSSRQPMQSPPTPAPLPNSLQHDNVPDKSVTLEPLSTPVSPASTSKTADSSPSLVMGKIFRDPLAGNEQRLGPNMVMITGGSFMMGNTLSSAYPEEQPAHRVTLPDFAISQYEISFDDYELFTRHSGQRRPDDNGWGTHKRPVINVSWQDASDYASWLSRQTGHNYRLPTEAEWEYAAGAGKNKLYWWGNKPDTNRANCYDCGSVWDGKKTAPIGSFPANPFGLFDSAGNVAEWVQDCEHPNYRGAPNDNRVWLSGDCTQRMMRGGSYRSPRDQLITTRRTSLLVNTRVDHVGFRLVREN